MKGGLVFFAFIFLLLLSLAFNSAQNKSITGNRVTGETITGDLASALSVNITVSGPPMLTLLSPKNGTYISSQDLILNFTVSNENDIKYSMDSAANVTIAGNVKFNTTEGSHLIFLYANNSQGTTAKNVTFFIDSGKFMINYTDYAASTKGNSTDFNESSFEDSQNLSGVVIENTQAGKISFWGVINLTDDLNATDNAVDLNSNINVSFNRIEINSTALPNFNKSATLNLYNLTFAMPRILRNGEVCPSEICTGSSYSGGILTFNVTGFSIYTSEETPAAAVPAANSGGNNGGGGGGGGIVSQILPQRGISVSSEEIKVKLKQGQVTTEQLTITNNNPNKESIKIESQKVGDLLVIREPSFELNPGESKTLTLDIIARADTKPDLYLGTLLVKSNLEQNSILVAVEVQSLGALLDTKISIQPDSLQVLPGDNLLAEITLFNLGTPSRNDVNLEYIMKNSDGKEIPLQKETVAVETQADFIRQIKIPDNADYGRYFLYVKAVYNGEIASASDGFEVVQYKVTSREKIFIGSIIILITIITVLIIYLFLKDKNTPLKTRKLELKDLIKNRK